MGSPAPERILPAFSLETGIFIVFAKERTDALLSMPVVPSNTWTITTLSELSRTLPLFMLPSDSLTLTSSS